MGQKGGPLGGADLQRRSEGDGEGGVVGRGGAVVGGGGEGDTGGER